MAGYPAPRRLIPFSSFFVFLLLSDMHTRRTCNDDDQFYLFVLLEVFGTRWWSWAGGLGVILVFIYFIFSVPYIYLDVRSLVSYVIAS